VGKAAKEIIHEIREMIVEVRQLKECFMAQPELALSVKDCAALPYCGYKVNEIYGLIRDEKIPTYGAARRIKFSEVDRALRVEPKPNGRGMPAPTRNFRPTNAEWKAKWGTFRE